MRHDRSGCALDQRVKEGSFTLRPQEEFLLASDSQQELVVEHRWVDRELRFPFELEELVKPHSLEENLLPPEKVAVELLMHTT